MDKQGHDGNEGPPAAVDRGGDPPSLAQGPHPGAPGPNRPTWVKVLEWWPMLLAPLVIPAVYGARAMGWNRLIAKAPHEIAGIVILSVAVLICGLRSLIRRDRIHPVMLALSVAFLCREIHFVGTSRGVYVAVALIGVWCWFWRKSLLKVVWKTAKGRWLTVVVWSYFVAMLIQRRGLKFLPDEQALHIEFEEVAENVAHLMLVIAGLI